MTPESFNSLPKSVRPTYKMIFAEEKSKGSNDTTNAPEALL